MVRFVLSVRSCRGSSAPSCVTQGWPEDDEDSDTQYARSMQKSMRPRSACFSALSGKRPKASRAMEP
jgi:hypothetical protein